jgi:hypothetical protein
MTPRMTAARKANETMVMIAVTVVVRVPSKASFSRETAPPLNYTTFPIGIRNNEG